MLKSQIAFYVIIYFAIMCGYSTAKDETAAPQTGPANAEFQKIFGEWKTLVGDLGALRVKYRTASKEERADIEKQWKDLIEKGDVMEPQLIESAKKAFAEAPNADSQITTLLLEVFYSKIQTDDYENALGIGKLLVDNHAGDSRTASSTGLAAVSVGDFEEAEKYLAMADKDGYYKKPNPKDKMADQAQFYFKNLQPLKTAWGKEQKIRDAESKADDLPRVLIKTNKGDMVVELFENEAPNTVANFITLVEKGFYNGLTFHRVLPGFMAQGGDPKGDGSGGPGYSIACECYKPNHRLHYRGSLSMAHAGRDTGGSQFFLTFVPTSFLDGKHTVFGRVIEGFDVLAKIQRRDPEKNDPPDPDKIIEAQVIRKRPHGYVVKIM
jgi:cyclophilin family peptidyl-prolyl cis-trans isomerase